MGWADYLPLLVPVCCVGVIVYALFWEKPRRRRAAAHPVALTETPETALKALEGDSGSFADVDRWLRLVTEQGGPGDLARLAALSADRVAKVGNTPAYLFRAIERSEGATRAALSDLRDRVARISVESKLALWAQMLEEDFALRDPGDPRLESLVEGEMPGVLGPVFADLAAREDNAGWRAARLCLVGWVGEFHPDHPGGDQTLSWLVAGLFSDSAAELDAAIEAFPAIAADHRFDPDAPLAARLRDRAVALASGEAGCDPRLSEALGEGLAALCDLTIVDATPLQSAAEARLAQAADATPVDPWPAAEELLRRGAVLLQALPFAQLALACHPRGLLPGAAACLALEARIRRARILQRADKEADGLARALLVHAPEPVVARTLHALSEEGGADIGWPDAPDNLAALKTAASRQDLTPPLRDRLCAFAG